MLTESHLKFVTSKVSIIRQEDGGDRAAPDLGALTAAAASSRDAP